MIFVSSACMRGRSLEEIVGKLAGAGFKHIELSGGMRYRSDIKEAVIALKEKWGLKFLLHNYFPPPKKDFVLNLASQDPIIMAQSEQLIKSAMDLSKVVGSLRYGFHAGFFMDIDVKHVGKVLAKTKMADKAKAMARFCQAFRKLQAHEKKIELYLENNVVSASNFNSYGKENPFMMTAFDEYKQMRQKINFKPLLDVGHLKVSCNTLGLKFEKELAAFLKVSDYVHISDNDGKSDTNKPLVATSRLWAQLKEVGLKGKTVSLEVYDSIKVLARCRELIEKII